MRSHASSEASALYTSGRASLKNAWSAASCTCSVDVLAEAAQHRLELRRHLRGEAVVEGGVLADHLGLELRPVRLGRGPRDQPVVRRTRLDGIGAGGGEHQRQAAAHAVADDSHARVGRALDHHVDGAGHVAGRLVEVERHHQLAGAVGFGGGVAVVQVRCERREPGVAEAVGDVLDVRHQAPPLLDHDHARASAVAEVAAAGAAVAREVDHLAHGRPRYWDDHAPSQNFIRSQSAFCSPPAVSNTIGPHERPRHHHRSPARAVDAAAADRSAAYRDDRAHVFHSWSAQATLDPVVIAGASGARFWDEAGRTYLDFASQLVNMNIGHQHPKLVAAIKEQADKLCTVAPIFANDARSEAARLIAELAPGSTEQGVLHQRRGRGHRERHAHGARAHRAPEGAHHLPQLPRRHRWRDHDDRRPPSLAERTGHARRGQVLGSVHLPLGVPCHRRRRGVRARPRASRRRDHGRGRAHDRRHPARDGGRHERHPRAPGRLSRRRAPACATSTAS